MVVEATVLEASVPVTVNVCVPDTAGRGISDPLLAQGTDVVAPPSRE